MKNLKDMTKAEKSALLETCKTIYENNSKSTVYRIAFQNGNEIHYIDMNFSDFWNFTVLETMSSKNSNASRTNIVIKANASAKKLIDYAKSHGLTTKILCTLATWENLTSANNGAKLEEFHGKKPDNKKFNESSDIVENGISIQLKFFGKSKANVSPVRLLEDLAKKALV